MMKEWASCPKCKDQHLVEIVIDVNEILVNPDEIICSCGERLVFVPEVNVRADVVID